MCGKMYFYKSFAANFKWFSGLLLNMFSKKSNLIFTFPNEIDFGSWGFPFVVPFHLSLFYLITKKWMLFFHILNPFQEKHILKLCYFTIFSFVADFFIDYVFSHVPEFELVNSDSNKSNRYNINCYY